MMNTYTKLTCFKSSINFHNAVICECKNLNTALVKEIGFKI